MIPKPLITYIETAIIPRYKEFDKAHNLSHVRTVIEESLALARLTRLLESQVIGTEDHILSRNGNRTSVRRLEEVVCSKHEETRFCLSLCRKREVNSHLVAVKVGVVSGTDQGLQL